MTFGTPVRRVLLFLIALGLITSTWVLWTRSRVPGGGPESELVVRLETVYESARLHGIPVDDLLDAYHRAGVTTLAIEAKSLARLEYAGQVSILPDPASGAYAVAVSEDGWPSGTITAAAFTAWLDPELAAWGPRGRRDLQGSEPVRRNPAVPAVYPLPRKDRVPRPEEVFLAPGDPLATVAPERDLLLGLSPADIELGRRHGFLLAAFIPNRPAITAGEALASLEGLGDGSGFSAVKFDSPTALGWPDPVALAAVGARLRDLGLPVVIDDKAQPGLEAVVRANGWRGVRQQPVWTRAEPSRFPEVAVERRQNFLYLQSAFFDGTSSDWLAQVTSGLRAIVEALEAGGLTMGRAVPLAVYEPPRPALALMVSAVMAAAVLGVLLVADRSGPRFGPDPTRGKPLPVPRWRGALGAVPRWRGVLGAVPRWRGLLGAGLVVFWALPVLAASLGEGAGLALASQLLASFAGVVVFPTLAVGLALRLGPAAPVGPDPTGETCPAERPRTRVFTSLAAHVLRVVLLTVAVAGVTTAGGILVTAIGSSTSFMLRLNLFLGTKLSLIVPPILAGLLFLGTAGLYPDERRRTGRMGTEVPLERTLAQLRRVLSEDVTFTYVFLLGLTAVAALVMVMRSGNFPIFGVSDIELQARAFLQQALLVRPRTKEFLIGYPALVLLLWWGPRWRLAKWRRWTALVLTVAAAVGLNSIGNTFAHQHIPVSVSLLRTVNGLTLGLPIGLAAAATAGAVLRVGRLWAGRSAVAGKGCAQRE